MWLIDRLFNRKIEGKSSLDNLESLANKVEYEGDKVKVNGDVEVGGNLIVDGQKIIDSGDLSVNEIEGLTITYAKWALSGKSLNIVVAGTVLANSALPDNTEIAYVELPEEITSKIKKIFGQAVSVDFMRIFYSEFNTVTRNIALRFRQDSSTLSVYNNTGTYTFVADGGFRYTCELLILGEQGEQTDE